VAGDGAAASAIAARSEPVHRRDGPARSAVPGPVSQDRRRVGV